MELKKEILENLNNEAQKTILNLSETEKSHTENIIYGKRTITKRF